MITRFEKLLLAAATLLTGLTGLLFAWLKYFVKGSDPYSVVNHPYQPALLSAHVLAAPALLFAFGLVARDHIVGKYRDPRARRGRRSGILATWVLLPMVFSGYALQVLTSPDSRRFAGALHLAAGILFLVLYAAHVLLASRPSPGEGSVRGQPPARPGRRLKRRKDAL